MSRDVMVSKALSKLLRHAAGEAGLKLDAEGFANVEQVVSSPFHLSKHGVAGHVQVTFLIYRMRSC